MDLNDLEKIRVEKINKLKENHIEPYPTRSYVNSTIRKACEAFETAEAKGETDTTEYIIAGRMRSLRVMGKLAFTHIEDSTGRLQLFLRVNEMGEKLQFFKDYFDLGDFVEAKGTLMRTKAGELSLLVTDIRMLAKAVSPLPAAKEEIVDGKKVSYTGLNDPELRYRQRYADLVVNDGVKDIFRKRAKIVSAIRSFLDSNDFLEVETPILQPIYGGAAARPFVTHHNQLHQDLFLRISFELYLKRLLVGGFDRVYEIGRDFRNEGVSYKHNPEFTQVEFYCAYFDYLKVMDFVEEMLRYTAQQTLGTTKFTYNGIEIDFGKPWNRVNMRQGIIDTAGIDIAEYPTTESLAEAMKVKGIQFKPGTPRGKLIDQLVGDYLEPTFVQPTFLYDYPWEISPLAKRKPDDPTTTERFEGFVAGMELCNAFTELNDPIDQEIRFLEMGRSYDKDDDENNPIDEDYLRAMRYGMPPCGGFGMGIDRLTMLLTDSSTIREVLLFPHLRDRGNGGENEETAAPAAQETAAEEKIDFSNVEIEPLFKDFVDFETFSKSDFRAVKVKDCVAVPKSKKLLKFTLDDGSENERTILSGIHAYYEPETLIGKTLVAIVNLPPRPMMGVESQGMLLSAVHHENGEEKLNLLMVDPHIPAGAKLY